MAFAPVDDRYNLVVLVKSSANQSHQNIFACSDVMIQMRPTPIRMIAPVYENHCSNATDVSLDPTNSATTYNWSKNYPVTQLKHVSTVSKHFVYSYTVDEAKNAQFIVTYQSCTVQFRSELVLLLKSFNWSRSKLKSYEALYGWRSSVVSISRNSSSKFRTHDIPHQCDLVKWLTSRSDFPDPFNTDEEPRTVCVKPTAITHARRYRWCGPEGLNSTAESAKPSAGHL
ncbi:hypothetical protein CLF_105796 [Clonorchis sinensis]|uniref:Uncharacterized protein n=1 Tax=Clonorchis sinensis TaxID=79923 RepID=G7YE77_CLOSI|nr:hypothetical protein CLF_105796 [Clonorchis sinensis]